MRRYVSVILSILECVGRTSLGVMTAFVTLVVIKVVAETVSEGTDVRVFVWVAFFAMLYAEYMILVLLWKKVKEVLKK